MAQSATPVRRDPGAPARAAQASGWLTLGEYTLILALIAVGKVDSIVSTITTKI